MAGITPDYEFDTQRFDTTAIEETLEEQELRKKEEEERLAREKELQLQEEQAKQAEAEKSNLDKVKEQGRATDAGQAIGAMVDQGKQLYDNTVGAIGDNPVNQELKKAIGVGAMEGVDSLWTAPERFIDMSTGEYARQEKEEGGYTLVGHHLNCSLKELWRMVLLLGGVVSPKRSSSLV